MRIYRKVENPIPFAPSALTRALTTAYLHARYAGLLLAPVQLSGEREGAERRGAAAAGQGRLGGMLHRTSAELRWLAGVHARLTTASPRPLAPPLALCPAS